MKTQRDAPDNLMAGERFVMQLIWSRDLELACCFPVLNQAVESPGLS